MDNGYEAEMPNITVTLDESARNSKYQFDGDSEVR